MAPDPREAQKPTFTALDVGALVEQATADPLRLARDRNVTVDHDGGRIHCETSPEGTTFVVEWPLVP